MKHRWHTSQATIHVGAPRRRPGFSRLLAFWLVSTCSVLALNPARKAESYSTQSWFTEHGLPSNKIRDVFQTRDGYLWLATGHGVSRFDGNQFTNFNVTTDPSLRGSDFYAAIEGPDGSLWFGAENGLFRRNGDRFEHFTTEHGLAHNYVRGLALTRSGTVVACTRQGFSFIQEGRITNPPGSWKSVTGVARAFLERSDGSFLLATTTGLWRAVGDTVEQVSGTGKLPLGSFFALIEASDGTAWIGYSGGVHCLRPDGTSEDFGGTRGLGGSRVTALRQDKDGNIWIAASTGLFRVTQGNIESAGIIDHTQGAPMHQLFEDREGGLWIASVTGLFRLKDTVGTGIGPAEGLEQTSVNSVFETRDGASWFGVWYGGVYRYDGDFAVRMPGLAELNLDRIFSVAEEADGTLWIGGESGLYRYVEGSLTPYFSADQEEDRKKQIAAQPGILLPGLAHNWVTSIATDPAGGIWVGTEGALYHGVAGKFRAYTAADGLPGGDFQSVIRTRDGDIWATISRVGVVRRHNGQWISYRSGRELAKAGPVAVFEDDTGAIWVTTQGGGVDRFKAGRWRTFTTSDGLADDFICGIVQDNLGFLWLGFPRGVMRIPVADFDALDAGTLATLQPRIFNQSDGLPRGEINRGGRPSAFRKRDGRLLFATDLGVAVVDPKSVKINERSPPVYIEKLMIDGAAADASRPVVVPPGQHYLQINYTAISLLAPEKVRFKIRLQPLDDDWVDSKAQREVRYAKLPAGNYTFEVKACNNDGVWNEEGAKFAFTVDRFFYQSAWFYVLVTASVVAAVLGGIRRRARNAARQMIVLGKLVDERTRELQSAKEGAEAAVVAKNESIAALGRAQDEIAAERTRFKFIFDVVPVGLSYVEPGLNGVRVVNPEHERITGLTLSDMEKEGAFERVTHPEDHVAQKSLTQKFKTGEIDHFTVEKRYLHLDGRIVWAALTRRMYKDPITEMRHAITTLVDVTERKTAEAKLAETHRELLATSRQAGMAEVATGVLHNVGNVLNSVNVSATIVLDRVRDSKTPNLRKLGGLLDANATQLGYFLTEDPRGCRIPAYIVTLASELEQEQQAIREELGHLTKNIEHIKDIVSMQQSYAKVSGVMETVSVVELVEDALRLNLSSLLKHGLDVIRHYVDRPVASMERHKVMQILVNLIRNAKHACDDARRPDKQLTISITVEGERVRIAVADNGVGIPPENLTRIFAHGFTTRRDGHGFGLHSGALVAKELGGTLRAQSDGIGKGAVFTLELPLGRESSYE